MFNIIKNNARIATNKIGETALTDNDLNTLIDLYYASVDFAISQHNINPRTRSFDSQLNKFIANRGKQLGTFLEDGKVLLTLEGKEDLGAKNPRVKRGCLQYYYLEKQDLIAYIGFRTTLRKNKIPKNPQVIFLSLYLMEIINDFYSSSFEEKMKLVKSVDKLFLKGAKFKKIIREAYEVLFLQCLEPYSVNEFKERYKIKDVFVDYSEDENIFDRKKFVFNRSVKKLSLSSIDLFLLKSSFNKVLQEAIDANYVATLSVMTEPIEELIEIRYSKFSSFAINKLYAKYPIQVNKKLYDKDGGIIIVSKGRLVVLKNPEFSETSFSDFLKLVKNNFRRILNNEEIVEDDNTYYYYKPNLEKKKEEEFKIQKIVQAWIDANPYCEKAYEQSVDYLEHLKQRKDFKLNLNEVEKVRKKSAKIQEKLIIEDEETSKEDKIKTLGGNKEETKDSSQTSYFENLKRLKTQRKTKVKDFAQSGNKNIFKDKNTHASGEGLTNTQNKYVEMVNSFTEVEYLVFVQLVFGTTEQANKVAKSNNVMLSLLIDNINLKASEHIDDIIIEEFSIIEDYKEDLIKSFS